VIALTVETPTRHRRPYRGSHIATRLVGPATIAALAVGFAVLWVGARPSDPPAGSFVGQLLGAEGVLLLSVGLVLISTLRSVEQFFDGVDKAAVWHRRVAIVGTVLIGIHIATTGNPNATQLGPTLGTVGMIGLTALVVWAIAPRWRSIVPRPLRDPISTLMDTRAAALVHRWVGSYGLWRGFHRLTGLFLALGFAHALLDASVFGSQVLRWSFMITGGLGLGFYAYRELLARRFARTHDYQVASVAPITDSSVEIWLRPLGRRFEFKPGQFALVNLEARDGWHNTPSPSPVPPRRTTSGSRWAPWATSPRTSATWWSPACRPSSAVLKATSTTAAAPSTRCGSPEASVFHRCSAGSDRPVRASYRTALTSSTPPAETRPWSRRSGTSRATIMSCTCT
jgi:hypothetical protein